MKNIVINGVANPYYLIDIEGNVFNNNGHEMAQFETNSGYMRVKLSKGCKRGMYTVHRLVGGTYLENPQEHPIINHIDGNKLNNHADNLEWCTYSHNNLHTIELHGTPAHSNKKVVQMDLVTREVITTFDSMTQAQEVTGVHKANISATCRGVRDKAGGFFWKYG